MRSWKTLANTVLGLSIVVGLPGCRQPEKAQAPPPDARRPEIKRQADLSAERQARIDAGDVVESESPVIETAHEEPPVLRPGRIRPIRPNDDAIQADILMINDDVLSVAEVLYPIRDELERMRREHTERGFRQQAARLIRRRAQQEIGSLLVYARAMDELQSDRRTALEEAIDKQVDKRISLEFSGSKAKLEMHLARHGLTIEQYRADLARDMIVQEYTREKLMPQVQVRRDELLAYYRRNQARYTSPAMRELLLMEFPFAKFLDEGQAWQSATQNARAMARLKAMRRARAAHEALEDRPFEEVAREFGQGLHAEEGGSWGMIGQPLQGAYEDVSRLAFEHDSGWVSEPIETETGWYIVGCGEVQEASRQEFVDVQDEIKAELMERRFTRLSVDYVVGLAGEATISSLDSFVVSAVERAEEVTTGDGETAKAR